MTDPDRPDRLLPFLHNYHTGGKQWQASRTTRAQVLRRMRPVADGAPVLWDYVERLIDESVERGYSGK